MTLLVLIKENLKQKKGTFIGLLILMIIISFIIITIVSVNSNVSARANQAHDHVNSGDVFTWMQYQDAKDEIINKTKKSDLVDHLKIKDELEVPFDINDDTYNKWTLASIYDDVYNVYNKNETAFTNKKELNDGEIYLSVSFESSNNVKIGDTVYINFKDEKIPFKIKGYIEEPVCGTSLMGFKKIFITKNDFKKLSDKVDDKCEDNCIYKYKYIEIYQKGNLNNNEFSRKINLESSIIDNSVYSLTKNESIYYHTIFNSIISGFLYSFAIILVFVAIIVISYSISNSIEMDFKNIGILKAIGVPNSKIKLSFIIEYLVVCITGCLIGGLLSLFGITVLGSILSKLTGLLPNNSINIYSILIIILLIILILLFIIFKTRKVSNVSPIKVINDQMDSNSKNIKIGNITSNLLQIKLAFRQLVSNLSKYISVLLISAILVFIMILISSLNNGIKSGHILSTLGMDIADIYVYSDSISYDEIEKEIKKVSDIKYKYRSSSNYFTIEGYQYYGQVISNPKLIKGIIEGKQPIKDNEVLITKIVSEAINKKIGDKISISFENKSYKYKIVGYYQGMNDVGKCFIFGIDAMRRIHPDYEFHSYDYKLVDSDSKNKIIDNLLEKYGDKIDVEDYATNGNIDIINSVFNILNITTYGIAVIFIFIAIILISHRMFVYEKKNFGIYKAMGFNTSKLRIQFSLRFFIISLIGSLLGIVLNLLFSDSLFVLIVKGMGITDYNSDYTLWDVLIPVIFVNTCFLLFTYLMSYKIKKVSTKELITE